ncbi:7TM GPCR protein [Aphelenchoides avenae]|nr:7TM GPCR protein [Aphelenchus avenae]
MEKNPVMIPYSRVLIMNVGFDVFYTFVSMATEVEIELNDGQYIIILNGMTKDFSVGWQIASIWIWEWSISAVCHVSAVEFVFRYLRVVRDYTMTYKWLAVSALIVTLCSVVNASFMCASIASITDHNTTFGHLMIDPIWVEEDGTRLRFLVASMDTIYLRLFIVSVCICDIGITSVLTLSSIFTMRTLAKQRQIMSERVKYMQTQLNRLMFAEFISLTSIFAIPIGALLMFLFLRVQWVGFGNIVAICVEWVPAVNPATTIFLVGSYRDQLVRLMKHLLLGKALPTTSVHPSDIQPSTSIQD